MLAYSVLVRLNTGRVDETVAVARRAARLADPGVGGVRIRYMLGRALLLAGRADEAAPLIEAAFEEHRGDQPAALAGRRAGMALMLLDRTAEARIHADEALSEARRSGGPLDIVYALSLRAQIAVLRGEWATAVACATEGGQLADALGQHGHSLRSRLADCTRGRGPRGAGDPRRARDAALVVRACRARVSHRTGELGRSVGWLSHSTSSPARRSPSARRSPAWRRSASATATSSRGRTSSRPSFAQGRWTRHPLSCRGAPPQTSQPACGERRLSSARVGSSPRTPISICSSSARSSSRAASRIRTRQRGHSSHTASG